jgi:hypothetical protein
MTKQLQILREAAGYPQTQIDCSRGFADLTQYFTLTANVVTNVVVPSTPELNLIAYFKYSNASDVWVMPNTATLLTLPSGGPAESTATLNPEGRKVVTGQTLQFLTDDATAAVGIEYYAIPS